MKKSLIYFLTMGLISCLLLSSCKKISATATQSNTSPRLTTEQRQLLKHDIASMNRSTPFGFGTFGVVKHLSLKGQHMHMLIEMCPLFYAVNRMKQAPEVIKTSLLDNLAGMDNKFDPLFSELARHGIGLCLELSCDNTEDVQTVYILPEELKLLSRTTTDEVNPNIVLKHHIDAYNLSLPMTITPLTTLTQAEIQPDYMVYDFSIEEKVGNEMYRLRAGKIVWGRKIFQSLNESPYPAVQEVVRLARLTQRNVMYRFTGDKTGMTLTIRLDLNTGEPVINNERDTDEKDEL